ncbi:MAG: fused MFS/spermidine synthase [Acidobacteriia bacterium]|nr:fused MFS/spermidine synthase [Terriglobia bacterium]
MRAGFGVRAVLVLIGFTAAIAQIVLLRELMVVFYGNESSIGLILASWLFWTSAGSGLAGHFAARARQPRRLMAGIQLLIAAILPWTILAVRAAKGLLQTVPGEVLGPGPMLLTSFSALGPLCVLSGALFTAGSKVYATAATTSAGEATGAVYLWEAAGSSGGGVVAGLVLVRSLSSLEIAWLLAVLNLMAASGLAIAARPLRHAAVGGLVGIAALLGTFGWPQRLEAISQQRFWRGLQLVATRNSVYGNLAVVGTEGSRSVYENGVVLFNVPDPAAAEEAVHYALLEHPSPRSLLLIGGGLNGSIAQALRHPTLERVDYVELDPAILDLAREYFPNEWLALRADSRVRLHVMDGRLFLKTTESAFDVVIVNLPEPQNAQLNRFYTVEFFREASRKLTPTGLLSFQLRSSETYISAELGQFLRSIHTSLRAVFPQVTAIPGETVHFFAAQQAGILASGAEELLARLHERNLHTSYVSEYFIPFRMTPDRLLDLDLQLRPGPGDTPATPVNRDFAPVAYYFDVALWSSQFNPGYRRLFRTMAGVSFGAMAATFGVVLAALAVGGRFLTGRRHQRQLAAGFSTAATGFTMIGLEMLLLLAFQAVYGYVYQQLAVVIAAFMAGMALGSWLAMGRPAHGGMRVLAITQVLAAAAPLVLLGLFQAIGRANSTATLAASQIAFPALALVSGMLGGYEFSVASRIFFGETETRLPAIHGPGTLYALDLAGSCLGAVLFSAWFVPVFGFFKTALLSAMVSLAPAVMAMLGDSETDPAE